jgi:adenine deaminase
MSVRTVTANIVDIKNQQIFAGRVSWADGRITSIERVDQSPTTYIMPGFVDSHIHIESSMLVPTEFARQAVLFGTVATVSDPHEIGNVLGVRGVEFMLENAAKSPLKFCFGAPSCVPATTFETAGATITVDEVTQLLADQRIGYLSEMMNFPGVLQGDAECLAKIEAAKALGKPVDGHAPGLRGEQAARYIAAGITTDHECFARDEALDKLAAGCKIAIREGSAARNFDELYPLLGTHPGRVMLCSDDKHPDELLLGHINQLVARAVAGGINLFDALLAACCVPVEHYRLPVGQLQVGDPADFIEVDSLESFGVLRTWIDGELVAEGGKSLLPSVAATAVNQFVPQMVDAATLAQHPALVCSSAGQVRCIQAIDGQIVTTSTTAQVPVVDGYAQADPAADVLKLVVVNRYRQADAAVAFIKGFGLRQGALASSVAHDSHNVIAVGTSDADIAEAINLVMQSRGGLSAASIAGGESAVLPLPVAGLMSTGSCQEVGDAYRELDRLVKSWHCPLRAPYMTLSFMALLVIPELKLSDLGLFDGARFGFTSVAQ